MATTDEEREIVKEAEAQADAKATSSKLRAEADAELADLASVPMAPLNQPVEDVLGRKLPKDPDKARAQQREAHAIREKRVEVDVARTQRGLPTKFATK